MNSMEQKEQAALDQQESNCERCGKKAYTIAYEGMCMTTFIEELCNECVKNIDT